MCIKSDCINSVSVFISVPKSVVTQMLKDTSQIEDPLLALEIDMVSTESRVLQSNLHQCMP